MTSGLRGNLIGAFALVALLTASVAPPESPVADAAQRGDIETVRSLLQSGADVNAAQGDGMTALHWAAMQNDVELAKLLVYAGANLASKTRLGAYTPLHLASMEGRPDAARILLDAGADPKAVTTTGATAMHLAAEAGQADIIRALVAKGADVNAIDAAMGRTPLMFAAVRNRVEATRALVEAGADLARTTKVVDYAKRSQNDVVEKERRAKVVAAAQGLAAPPDRGYEQGRGQGQGQGQARPAAYDDLVGKQGGFAALHYAVRDGQLEVARALLDAGADINQRTAGDQSPPLVVATINGNFDLAKMLLERGADPNMTSEDGAAPLFATINNEWALRTWYPQPTAARQQKNSYLDLMRALLQAGADPNTRTYEHIWYTAYNTGRMGVDFSGVTAFWRAAYALDVEAMKLLVAFGADPNIRSAVPRGEGTRVREGEKDLSGLPPAQPGEPSVHPLHAATGVGFGTSRVGQQHRHVPDGWLPAVKYLVEELGVDVNVRDHEGYSAIHHAASRGDNDVIILLVKHGAEVTFVSRRGQTTVDMANGPQQRVQPFPETIALLESLGAKNNHNCISC